VVGVSGLVWRGWTGCVRVFAFVCVCVCVCVCISVCVSLFVSFIYESIIIVYVLDGYRERDTN